MARPDAYLDVPAHPLGLAFHPNWEVVRERRAERECNAIRRQTQAADRAAALARSRQAFARMPWGVIRLTVEAVSVLGLLVVFWLALL